MQLAAPKLLKRVRGVVFFLGFVFSKAKYLPLTLISPLCHSIALAFYFLGHVLTYITSHSEPEHEQVKGQWYGFMPFREQYRLAASLGILGSLLGIGSYFIPGLIVFASWLFLASNIVNSIGELHKLNNPPEEDISFSLSRQNSLFAHGIVICMLSLVGAISTSLVYFIPAIGVTILVTSSLISIPMSIVALNNWYDYQFGDHQAMTVEPQSTYKRLVEVLGHNDISDDNPLLSPYQDDDLFKTPVSKTSRFDQSTPDGPNRTTRVK